MDYQYFLGKESPWSESTIKEWRKAVLADGKVRDYAPIVTRLQNLARSSHTVETYGRLETGHPLLRVTVGDLTNSKPTILITGGLHGYEVSGVMGPIVFIEDHAPRLSDRFNFVAYPDISPESYELNQRWTRDAQDPNRATSRNPKFPKVEECEYFMDDIERQGTYFDASIDCHETTDLDKILRWMRYSRYGTPQPKDANSIPQGFYLTLTKRETQEANQQQILFGRSVIKEVAKISPIAPEPIILEDKINHNGIILSPPLEGSMRTYLDSRSNLVAVTEVYPDHRDMTPEKAVDTQIAAIHGVLHHVARQRGFTF